MFKRPLHTGCRTLAPLLAAVVCATGVTATLAPTPARASADLDRRYALETVGYLKAWDNVDGLFADYVAYAYRTYFAHQSRFLLQDLSKADPVLERTRLPYAKVIEDPEIIGQVARAMRSQSVIRTKIRKDMRSYRFTIDWLISPRMELLATESFTLEEPEDHRDLGLGDFQGALTQALGRLVGKLPWAGHVTGRDGNQITVNLGSLARVRPGDELSISTLEEAKRHPILHAIVDWKFTETGKVQVEQVEEGISFGRIIEEDAGRQISRYQKVVRVIAAPRPVAKQVIDEKDEIRERLEETPRLGYVEGGLRLGGLSREYSATGTQRNGGGFAWGGFADGQLWFTREWFAELGLGYTTSGYTSQNPVTGTTTLTSGIASSVTQFKLAAGYSYLITGELFGPKGWVKLGFRSNSYDLTASSSERTGPISFRSLYLGIGGDLPLRGDYGVLMNLEFGMLRGATEGSGFSSGTVDSASDVSFFIGGYYRWNPRITIRGGFEIQAQGAQFTNGTTLSHKVFSFSPSIVYYF